MVQGEAFSGPILSIWGCMSHVHVPYGWRTKLENESLGV